MKGKQKEKAKIRLKISLVPRTSWFTNLRSILSNKDWDLVRKDVYAKANYRCEICQGQGPKHPVECHERWSYNEDTGVQKLVGLIALCPACHEVKHIGLAQVRGRYQQALSHLMKINGWTKQKAEHYVQKCWARWVRRSQQQWELDVSFIDRVLGDLKNSGENRKNACRD